MLETMSAVLATTASRCRKDEVFITFKDVDTLLVGWVGVGVVWRCEHPAVDVTDPLATIILVGALAAMFAGGI